MEVKDALEKIYENPGAVWTRRNPPKEIIELVKTCEIKPCRVLDVGCGEGKHSIYLAKKGFDVVGIDLSENAIKHAKENAKKAGVDVEFIVMNIADLGELNKRFDFVLEWAIMHFIDFSQREKYVENIYRALDKGGKYLSVCFNDQSSLFGGTGKKIRQSGKSGPGLKMYFSSKEELDELFSGLFKIDESKVIERIEETGPHAWNYFFMEKKYGN